MIESSISEFGNLNVNFGWIWMVLGITTGSILGMWSFGGPFPLPPGHKTYDALPRRLTRLAHIAFFALPLICITYGQHIDTIPVSDQLKMIGSYGMIICMVGVPTLLMAAAVYLPFKYLEAIPVGAGTVALYIMAYGKYLLL